MIILSLGSNLSSVYGDRFDNLNLAMEFLNSYQITVKLKSSFYETYAYPNKNINSSATFYELVNVVKQYGYKHNIDDI